MPGSRHWTDDRASWRALCEFWASDLRTHITPARWEANALAMAAFAKRLPGVTVPRASPPRALQPIAPPEARARLLTLSTPSVRIRLNLRKGLAIDALWLGPGEDTPLLRTLPHGYYEDIGMGFDWFSGTTILERQVGPKIADLSRVAPRLYRDEESGDIEVHATIETELGPIEKRIILCAGEPRIKYRLTIHWSDWPSGSLRLGNFTLNPEAFAADSLFFRTHNGGRNAEIFELGGHHVDHGAPISFLVSARAGVGMTEGRLEIGDAIRVLRLDVDMATAALLGMVTHRPVDKTVFTRIALSAMETDETRKPTGSSHGPREFAFSIGL